MAVVLQLYDPSLCWNVCQQLSFLAQCRRCQEDRDDLNLELMQFLILGAADQDDYRIVVEGELFAGGKSQVM